ncbi:MAG TPA: hypothetical protein VES67_15400 [Vicinamibacterales bacterium]|nr:hypothetical protein [Vicinamibacterales bacterium]
MSEALRLLAPDPAGALWLGWLLAFILFGDFSRLTGPRNRALLGLLMLSPLLARIFGFNDAVGSRLAAWVFTAVYVMTGTIAVWAAVLALRPTVAVWRPNLDHAALRALVAALVVLNAVVVFGQPPDDAGYYTNLGAQRWMETGTLPYGDPLLKGPDAPAYGAAATYGPVLYAAHVPFQLLLGATRNRPDLNPKGPSYVRPPVMATQLACFTFYVVGLVALYAVVRRFADTSLALGAVALFASSPYVLGLGGSREVITGLPFISHIAPSAVMLAALALVSRPTIAGSLLAIAAGILFFPVFVFPLWLGWMIAHRAGAVRFTAGFLATGVAIAAFVVLFTHAPPGTRAVSLFLESTLEHQEGVGPKAYGASQFGFWGTHPNLAAFWQTPLFGGTSLFKPTFIVYAMLAIAAFFIPLARPRSIVQLAALTAMLTAAVQLWKTHAAGSYVEWYYPFLIVALLLAGQDARSPARA